MGDIAWEHIQKTLGAEACGREPHAVVSKRTLFGIESSLEAQMAALANDEEDAGLERVAGLRARLEEAAAAIGPRLVVGRADRYFVLRARSGGYDIPSYPFSRSGDLQAFLSDEGVDSVPEWYCALGVQRPFDELAGFTVVAYRAEGAESWSVALADGPTLVDPTRLVPLAGSDLLANAGAATLASLESALDVLGAWPAGDDAREGEAKGAQKRCTR